MEDFVRSEGIIRRIIVGVNPKDGMSFTHGQAMGALTISNIIKDKNYFYKFGKMRFLIYVTKERYTEESLWKEVIDMPVTIEYDSKSDVRLV